MEGGKERGEGDGGGRGDGGAFVTGAVHGAEDARIPRTLARTSCVTPQSPCAFRRPPPTSRPTRLPA